MDRCCVAHRPFVDIAVHEPQLLITLQIEYAYDVCGGLAVGAHVHPTDSSDAALASTAERVGIPPDSSVFGAQEPPRRRAQGEPKTAYWTTLRIASRSPRSA